MTIKAVELSTLEAELRAVREKQQQLQAELNATIGEERAILRLIAAAHSAPNPPDDQQP
jgi:hypothetical protein